MPSEPESPAPLPSSDRLWAEQLAMGLGLFLVIVGFMAIVHPGMLASGMAVLGPNDVAAYGLASLVGIVLQVVVHELGTLIVAWRLKLPLRIRFFGFGANAAAILLPEPRRVWRDAVVGFAGPATGIIVSVVLAVVYDVTQDPFYLGMACIGYFYNLITLLPILDFEGGWIAPAIAPQAWLLGLIASGFMLANTATFNLVLLGIVCFAVPRFINILRVRAPRTDLECTTFERVVIPVAYFAAVLALAYFGSTTFAQMPTLIRGPMGMGD